MAGRNLDNDSGYVILRTKSLDEAKSLMAKNFTVKSGTVIPTYHKFRVALINSK